MVYSLLCLIITVLCVKIILMKKSAREIVSELSDRLQTDTNTLLHISSHDRDMRFLADSINKQLRILRREHLQYHQGNSELKNAVTIIVAQRVSTIKNADRILVMEEGRVVGDGTHDELLASNKVYREIALSQLSESEVEGK